MKNLLKKIGESHIYLTLFKVNLNSKIDFFQIDNSSIVIYINENSKCYRNKLNEIFYLMKIKLIKEKFLKEMKFINLKCSSSENFIKFCNMVNDYLVKSLIES